MGKKRSAAQGGEADLESDRAQARDERAGREKRREPHIRADPSGCRAKHAAESPYEGDGNSRT